MLPPYYFAKQLDSHENLSAGFKFYGLATSDLNSAASQCKTVVDGDRLAVFQMVTKDDLCDSSV